MGGGEGERGRNWEGKGEGEGCYLDSIGRLFESDQHIPVSSAGRIPGTELRESGWGTGEETGRARGKHRGEVTRRRRGAQRPHRPPTPSTAHAATTPSRRPPHTDRPPTHLPRPEPGPRPSPARSTRPPARWGRGSPSPAAPAVRSPTPPPRRPRPPSLPPQPPAGRRAGIAARARSVGTFMKVSTAPLAVSR